MKTKQEPDFLSVEQKLDCYISIGKELGVKGNFAQAERTLKTAISMAERESGKDNIIVGYVLIELCDLYEKEGMEKDAQKAWKRLSLILEKYSDWIDLKRVRK